MAGKLILSEKNGALMVCESMILMPPQTQYLPIAGISPTDPWISQTDDERTAREAHMSVSICYIMKIANLYVVSWLILVSISIGNPPIGLYRASVKSDLNKIQAQ